MLINILIIVFTLLLTIFIFWKRLREDYSGEIIFNSILTIFACFGASLLIAQRVMPAWFFWIGLLGVGTGLTFSVYKNNLRIYESLEALIFALIPLLGIFFLYDAVNSASASSFVAFMAMLLLIFVFYFVDTHYKNFSWYRSGKIGLSGLSVLLLFFLTRSIVAAFVPSVLSFSGNLEPVVSGIFAVVAGVAIFLLGKVEK